MVVDVETEHERWGFDTWEGTWTVLSVESWEGVTELMWLDYTLSAVVVWGSIP